MLEVVCFHSKPGMHIQKMDYESVPFTCIHCLKLGHKVNHFPKVKDKKTRKSSISKTRKEKKIWKKRKLRMDLQIRR